MSPSVATRIVSAMASVETPRSAATCGLRADAHLRPVERRRVEIGVCDARDASHLARELARGVVDRLDRRPVTISGRSRWPLSLRNQKRMSGMIGETRSRSRASMSFCVTLALRLVDVVDDERRLARLSPAAAGAVPPIDEDAERTSGSLAQHRRDRVGDALGVVERRARRQLDRRAASAPSRPAGRKPDGSSCVDHERADEHHERRADRDEAVAHRPARTSRGVEAHDRRLRARPRRACARRK